MGNFSPHRPIVFDVHLDAHPPAYELLFWDGRDPDFRIAQVLFKRLPAPDVNAFAHAFEEFRQLSREDLDWLRSRAEVIDRTSL